jgi:hypothetical protein
MDVTATNFAFWRQLREDFESLPPGEYIVTWNSHPPRTLNGTQLRGHWAWWRFPDESLRARLCAIALRGAKALGSGSEDAWFDRLREADFVMFKLCGDTVEQLPDGSVQESRDGSIYDVVKHSITLCHMLEAECVNPPPEGCGPRITARKGGLLTPGSLPGSARPVGIDTEHNGNQAEWAAIQFVFLSDERVQISSSGRTATCNYAELGFADGRVGRGEPKPNRAWIILRTMAEEDGVLRNGAKTGGSWAKVEKQIQAIRKRLRAHFGIAADPLPFTEGLGYRSAFKIRCGPSFHT